MEVADNYLKWQGPPGGSGWERETKKGGTIVLVPPNRARTHESFN